MAGTKRKNQNNGNKPSIARPNYSSTQHTKMDTGHNHPVTNGKHKTKTYNNVTDGVTAVDSWMDIQCEYANHSVGNTAMAKDNNEAPWSAVPTAGGG